MSRRSSVVCGFVGCALLGAMAVTAACTGDDPVPVAPVAAGTSSGNASSSSGAATSSSSGSPTEGGGPCVTRCADPSTLETCDGQKTTCQFSCVEEGGPHCQVIKPSGAITSEMLTLAGTKPTTLSNSVGDTRTGAIDGVREPNEDPLTMEVKSGVGFRLMDIDSTHRIGVWVFQSLTVPKGVNIHFPPDHAVGFVVQKTAVIEGVIDLRPYFGSSGPGGSGLCGMTNAGGLQVPVGGPGGGRGALPGYTAPPTPGLGVGLGPGAVNAGPGGGGYLLAGGVGGDGSNSANKGAVGGGIYGSETLVPLVGGSGGGPGGGSGGQGGGGGGAFQLVVGESLTIGNGIDVGGINAGGCGGKTSYTGAPPGGGGSGGAILIETPALDLKELGAIAANGGAGGGGGGVGEGEPGELSMSGAKTVIKSDYGVSGPGGAGSSCTGGNAFGAAGKVAAGAGGGACGRIRINNLSGSIVFPSKAILSPPKTAAGAASFGKLELR